MSDHGPWRPSRAIYLRRTAIVSALTFCLFLIPAGLIFVNSSQGPLFALLMPLAMTAIFVIEDYSKWRMVRQESWYIEDGHLIHQSVHGSAVIALTEIAEANHRFDGSVVMKLHNGQQLRMRYLAQADVATNHINAQIPP